MQFLRLFLFMRFHLANLFLAVTVSSFIASSVTAQTFRVLHAFNEGSEGVRPSSTPIEGTDGRIYYSTKDGGNSGSSSVESMNRDRSDHQMLRYFVYRTSSRPSGLIEDSCGRIFGTTRQVRLRRSNIQSMAEILDDGNVDSPIFSALYSAAATVTKI